MTPLERITERVNRNGDLEDATTPRPLLTLEEFFEGNTADGSICCNCSPMPAPSDVYEALKRIRQRPDVADVRVQVNVFDDPRWPFSETVWVITSVENETVKSWFPQSFAPDDTWVGWTGRETLESVAVPERMRAVACWWD